MSINFTKNLEQYTNIHRTVREKQFMEFTSKKQLQDANVLNEKELQFVTSIKGTFSFALHSDGRYMAVTLYKVLNNERKYNFLVLDLVQEAVAEVGSIKEAKAEILELIASTKSEEQEQPETTEETQEESQERPARKARKKSKTEEVNAEEAQEA